jgi:hypothetical protein
VQAGICDVCHAFTGNVSRVTQRCRGAYARAWFGLSLVPIKQSGLWRSGIFAGGPWIFVM